MLLAFIHQDAQRDIHGFKKQWHNDLCKLSSVEFLGPLEHIGGA